MIDIVTRTMTSKEEVVFPATNTRELSLMFKFKIESAGCPAKIDKQAIIKWRIDESDTLTLYYTLGSGRLGFWVGTNSSTVKSIAESIPIPSSWSSLRLDFTTSRVSLFVNNELVGSTKTQFLGKFSKNLSGNAQHQMTIFASEELKLAKLRMKTDTTNNKQANAECNGNSENREDFCEIELESEGKCKLDSDGNSDVRKVFLTPEIYYKVKSCKKRNNKKKNIGNNYISNMSGRICISNPLVSFKGFTMDFIVKNLILFGLLFLFQTYLANPSIDTNAKLYVCGVVLLLYNLLNVIFVILENIFVWACQYSTQLDELVTDEL